MQGPFPTHFRVSVMLIVEDLTVTVKYRTAIKVITQTGLRDIHIRKNDIY
jgi:hypothetical protein